MEQSDDNVTNIEHLVKINIEVGYPPFLKPDQCLMILIHPFNKSGIWIFHKELLRPLTTNDILNVTEILVGIPLEMGYHMEQNLWPVGQQLDPRYHTVSPTVLNWTGIIIYQRRDNKGIYHVIGYYTGL